MKGVCGGHRPKGWTIPHSRGWPLPTYLAIHPSVSVSLCLFFLEGEGKKVSEAKKKEDMDQCRGVLLCFTISRFRV